MRVIDRRLFLNESGLIAPTAPILAQPSTATAHTPASTETTADARRAPRKPGRGRGGDRLRGFAGRAGCEVTVVCDADKAFAKKAIEAVKAKQDKEPTFEQDVRKVVSNKDIDIISIATPNHWHALMAIWGLQNGK